MMGHIGVEMEDVFLTLLYEENCRFQRRGKYDSLGETVIYLDHLTREKF